MTTAASAFVRAAAGAKGWEGQSWDRRIEVPVTTIDALISAHEIPAFVKIDVEGFEHDEFTTIQRDVAHRCLSRLSSLGAYRFNLSMGESHTLSFDD